MAVGVGREAYRAIGVPDEVSKIFWPSRRRLGDVC